VPRRAQSPQPTASGDLVLGRYRLRERLGAGGFGVVWRAHDEVLQRDVAIKRVEHACSGDRAQREALATARLSHPAIAALYEARRERDSLYLISELVAGEALHKRLAADPLEDHELLEIGVALSEALEHAHACGVIHRDVKPANVVVLAHPVPGRVPAKLTDFGSALISGEDALTRTGDVLGTLAYMAPEQADGLEATAQSDLYSLALVLYEALSGVNPQRGPSPAATARKLGARLPSLARYRPELAADLIAAIDRALSPEPAHRGTLGELRAALAGALETSPRSRGQASAGARTQPLRPRQRTTAILPRARTALRQRQPGPGARETRPEREPPEQQAPVEPRATSARFSPRLGFPRMYWWAGALALITWQAFAGRPGLALVLGAGAAPLLALPRRSGPGWLTAALAPLLGTVGLAGAFPALAGQAARWTARAALAALGYWWLLLAQALTGRVLWLWPPTARAPVPASVWSGSLSAAATHALRPLISMATIEGVALWAFAAAVLPWMVRGRSAARDVVGATVWVAALVSAQPLLDGGLGLHGAHPSPRGALLGGLLCGALAVCARALRGPVTRPFPDRGACNVAWRS
jgi:hypothetical protein